MTMKKAFCGLCSLRTGAIVCALLEIVFAFVATIFYSLGLAAVGYYEDEEEIRAIGTRFRIPFVELNGDPHGKGFETPLISIFTMGLLTSIVSIGFAILLLVGIKKCVLYKMKAWRVFKVCLLSISILFFFSICVTGFSTLPAFVCDVFSISFHSYLLWVVHQYIMEFEEETILAMSPSIRQTKGKIDVSFPL